MKFLLGKFLFPLKECIEYISNLDILKRGTFCTSLSMIIIKSFNLFLSVDLDPSTNYVNYYYLCFILFFLHLDSL